MTRDEAINKVISIAEAEIGYLEKKSNALLDDKTANAGTANYTKYWRDIKPSFQGQAWCACFVTWVFVRAFGKDNATNLLKHYPYVYCPTMKSLFTLNSNPKRGDIVLFYRNGTFAHTGIVTSVSGDYFTTIEGNTSGGSTIIANGGGVCRKGYYNSNLSGTKFVTPDYSNVIVEEASAHWAKSFLDKLVSKGYIENKEIWSNYDAAVTKAQIVALIDKSTGGMWTSEKTDASIHWVQPHVISLSGKHIIEDKSQWLTNPDDNITKALFLALIDKSTGGMKAKYINRRADHWGRNYLDSLCDKSIIDTPSAWTDFDAKLTRGGAMALIVKALIK